MNILSIKISDNETIDVEVKRKKVKKVSIKVFPDGKVVIIVPTGVTEEWIKSFLNDKKNWITEKLADYKKTNNTQHIKELKSGMSIKFFDIDTLVIIEKSNTKQVYYDGDKIIIETMHTEKKHIIKKQLEDYMRNELKKVLQNKLEKLYYIISKDGYDLPEINIRKMKTMWGSCNPAKEKMNFNLFLYQSPKSCIEYVMLHELLHFIHPNHSAEFYNLLSLYMPDWQERKSKLDNEIVSYIE